MPVVCFIAWLLLPYDFPAIFKFLIAVISTMIICLVSYHYLVQNSWVGERLSGVRFKAPWPWEEETKKIY
jgi:multisubunit Na+/H+ antiporter MnhE subunit